MKNVNLLTIATNNGFETVHEMLTENVYDSICVGVCRKCKNDENRVEPDCTDGYCDSCESEGTVVSVLILAGIC